MSHSARRRGLVIAGSSVLAGFTLMAPAYAAASGHSAAAPARRTCRLRRGGTANSERGPGPARWGQPPGRPAHRPPRGQECGHHQHELVGIRGDRPLWRVHERFLELGGADGPMHLG